MGVTAGGAGRVTVELVGEAMGAMAMVGVMAGWAVGVTAGWAGRVMAELVGGAVGPPDSQLQGY